MKKSNVVRLTSVVLLLCMVFSLVACNSESTSSNSSTTTQAVPEIVQNTPGYEKWETAIDYSSKDNWLSVPTNTDKSVDVIYYYPTTFSKASADSDCVADITDTGMRSGAQSVFQSQATVFGESCNIYAPYYRQVDATYALTVTDEQNSELMRYSASKDPTDALDYYFENYNNGRPFILAGHSQGSEVSSFLLADYMKAHPEYFERMVAAYIIGYSITDSYLKDFSHLKFAESANDTGVIVSWNTEGPENKNAHNAVVLEGAISINPLNWKRDNTKAGVEENLGSFLDGKLVAGVADAQLDTERGVVVCTTADSSYAIPAEMSSIFGIQSFHGQDYGFYYANIAENVKTRIDTYFLERK